MTSSGKTTSAHIIPVEKCARWSHLHDHLHDLIQILLERQLEINNAGSYTLKECLYVSDEKCEDAYYMRFILHLRAPGPENALVRVGLCLGASIFGVPGK